MDTKIKRQLMVSVVMIGLLLSTLILWYENFDFHTYVSKVNYQLCFDGENDDILIQSYEVYQGKADQRHGGARIAAKKQGLFQKGDKIEFTIQFNNSQTKEVQFVHQYTIKDNDEVFYIDEQITKENLDENSLKLPVVKLSVARDDKSVYEEDIELKSKELIEYNGGNKNYTLQNVYVTNTWMKTGQLSSKVKNLAKKYPYMTIDYLSLKTGGQSDNINDYDRFIYIKGKTQDFLDGKLSQTMIYDGEGTLLDKKMICVIALSDNEKQQNPFTFKIDIHGNIKAGD